MKLLIILLTFLSCLNLNAQNNSGVRGPIEYIYDSSGKPGLKVYIFSPVGNELKKKSPAIVIFHGGGWSIGEPSWAFGLAKKNMPKRGWYQLQPSIDCLIRKVLHPLMRWMMLEM